MTWFRAPWRPAPFIPDEAPWEDPTPRVRWRRVVVWLLASSTLTFFTLLNLEGYADPLLLALKADDAQVVTAEIVGTASHPAVVTYAFAPPTGDGPSFHKTVAVPVDVARLLKPGDRLDVLCLRSRPSISVPLGQAELGQGFYAAALKVFVLIGLLLGCVPLAATLVQQLTGGWKRKIKLPD